MPVITTILFYGYTSLTGTHLLWADVIVFYSICHWRSMDQPSHPHKNRADAAQPGQNFAIAGLVIMVLAFSLLSYYPFRNFLFAHPGTGEYGILSDYDHDHEH